MDKSNLAYKLTSDVFKHYGIKDLEDKYNLSGGKLFVAVYNEILKELIEPDLVVITGEDKIPD